MQLIYLLKGSLAYKLLKVTIDQFKPSHFDSKKDNFVKHVVYTNEIWKYFNRNNDRI